jgi:hypothetical protein
MLFKMRKYFFISIFLFLCGCEKGVLPNVITYTPSIELNPITWQNGEPIPDVTLILTGELLSGGSKTKRGFVWATHPNPTELDNYLFDAKKGNGIYSLETKDFSFGKKYFIRAFSENSEGRTYGAVKEITIPSKYVLFQSLIGTSFGGGIIAFIDSSGHGLISAPSDLGPAEWTSAGVFVSGAEGTAIGTGNQNTIDILMGGSTAGIAARLCGDLVLGGYSDWHLPSKDEFHVIYHSNLSVLDFRGDRNYWTSSKYVDGPGQQWGYGVWRLYGGSWWKDYNLQNNYFVRAVRYF